ncbi:ABC transporter permease subunit, partial [Ensifer sp. NBAIM29]|nr:ABC transporter permease subunit [Ensifer sp. NBAIM29]
ASGRRDRRLPAFLRSGISWLLHSRTWCDHSFRPLAGTSLFGCIEIPAWVAGIGTLGIHYAAYCSECYRGGIENVDAGQWEACKALNLSPARTWRAIILPQAMPPVVPALGNYFIGMFKDAPILAAIAILEMLQQAKNFGSENYRFIEVITMVGFFYLVLSLVGSAIVQSVSFWLNRRHHLQ